MKLLSTTKMSTSLKGISSNNPRTYTDVSRWWYDGEEIQGGPSPQAWVEMNTDIVNGATGVEHQLWWDTAIYIFFWKKSIQDVNNIQAKMVRLLYAAQTVQCAVYNEHVQFTKYYLQVMEKYNIYIFLSGIINVACYTLLSVVIQAYCVFLWSSSYNTIEI